MSDAAPRPAAQAPALGRAPIGSAALLCAVALWGALGVPPASAHQLPFTTISIDRGLPQSQVSALATDQTGALWVGTPGGGLARFDGTSFETYTVAEGLSDNGVTALARDPEGRLWIGTERGMSIRDHRGLRALGAAAGPALAVRALLPTRTGEMWVGTDRGLARYDRRTLAPLPTMAELDGVEVSALVEDRAGRVWIGTAARGLARFEAGRLSFVEPTVPGSRVRVLLQAQDGRVWIGTDAGVFVHDGERLSAVPLLKAGAQPVVRALIEDRSGALWLGTEGKGLGRYRDGDLAWFTEEDGLGASTVWALALDLEGGVWAGTYRGGLSAYRDLDRLPTAVHQALSGTVIRGILEDRRGRLWFATDDRGAASFDGSRLRWLRARDGLSHDFVLTVFEDRRGTLWFGTLDGLTRSDGRALRRFGVEDGLPGRVVRSVVEDRSGALWVGTSGGVARLDGGGFHSFRAGDDLSQDAVNVLYVDDAGRLWAGTSAGLSVLDGDRFSIVSRALALPEGSVYSIRQHPESGDLWVGLYGQGLVRIPRAAMERPGAPSSPGTQLFARRDVPEVDRVVSLAFDPAGDLWVGTERGIDRLRLSQPDASGRPAVSHWGALLGPDRIECIHNASLADRRGRVWVGTLAGPLLFDPRRQSDTPVPLRVSLTAAGPVPGEATWMPHIRGTTPGSLARLELGPGDNRAAFAFEAISLSAPSHVRYQFKLEGYQSGWSPVTTTAQAFYPKLPPGEFEFRVRATRDGRTWFEAPQPFRLRVLAPLWRRGWFQALGLLASALLVYGGHRVGIARLRAHERELQVEVLERDRAERDLARTNRALRVLGECNRVVVQATNESQLLDEACRLVVEMGGYALCWVGWAEDDPDRTVRPVAVAGEDREYVASLQTRWADNERGRGPTGVAIRTGRPAVARDLGEDPGYGPWREGATARGLKSSIALPIAREGRVLGALNIYATQTDAIGDQEVELLSELANNLAYGIVALRTRREGEQAAEALRESETRFRTLAETSVSATFTYDEDDRFTYVNPAVTQITGYSADELLGRRFLEILPPESRRLVEDRRALRGAGEPVPGRYELALRNRAGQERWIDLGIGFVELQGRRTGVATAFDITERRLAEEAVRERARLAAFAAEVAVTHHCRLFVPSGKCSDAGA